MAQMTMIQAITDALRTELRNDENVLVFGEDVGVNGGVFRATEGLHKEFGEDRVFDTPLAESGIGGLADHAENLRVESLRLVRVCRDLVPDEACLHPDRSKLHRHLCNPDRRVVCLAGRGCRT